VESNGLSHIVEVIQSSAEDLQLPCKVDIIISEWMGYILLRESMLDSVIRARDKWLKPGGCMFPSHATMLLSAISYEDDREGKMNENAGSMQDWKVFSEEMKKYYNVDMSVLTDPYRKEQEDYYIYSSLWTELKPEHVVGQPVVIKHLDLNVCTLKDAEAVEPCNFNIEIPFPITISGYASWFTVDFNGSTENPVSRRVILSTGPEMGYTHWGQQVKGFSCVFIFPSTVFLGVLS
jgi:protein arginine N-methyltransferase 1